MKNFAFYIPESLRAKLPHLTNQRTLVVRVSFPEFGVYNVESAYTIGLFSQGTDIKRYECLQLLEHEELKRNFLQQIRRFVFDKPLQSC